MFKFVYGYRAAYLVPLVLECALHYLLLGHQAQAGQQGQAGGKGKVEILKGISTMQ